MHDAIDHESKDFVGYFSKFHLENLENMEPYLKNRVSEYYQLEGRDFIIEGTNVPPV